MAGSHLTIPELIAKKRDGTALSREEIGRLVRDYTAGSLPDYQMAALAMAVFFRGMTPEETANLTMAMRDSGSVLDLSAVGGVKVDKHSTGGVGDKVSICLAPMVAACGVPVPMISGRGLGHTGGTVDKLESIAGFRMDGTPAQFRRQLAKIGCALYKQTSDIAPADRKLYALRDVTGTVESIPLITASILSKKLAEGIDALVLDVKVGRGAFMKTQSDAEALARSIVRVGTLAGKRVTAMLTRMDSPLGLTVGNSIETAEAFEVLHGGGPDDLVECTLALGAEMLVLGRVAKSPARGRKQLMDAIRSGAAATMMERLIEAQGGDPRVVREPDRLPLAKHSVPVRAAKAGYVREIDALEIGWSAVALGAGRTRADQQVDPAVGIVLAAKPGDRVEKNGLLATVRTHRRKLPAGLDERIREAFVLGARPASRGALVIKTIRR